VAPPQAAARTAFALKLNVEAAVGRWGLERTGFLTLTFADHVLEPKEAQRRLNSLATHVLRPRYGEAIRVYERQKSGRIHYHLLVNVGADIRTGFDFGAIKRQDYRSASPALRAEWAFWRRTAKLYGFGRTELLPVISSAVAVARYVGKYISKHLDVREERDLGVRLVSYIGPRVATVKFAWAQGGQAWRAGLEALVRDLAAAGQIDEPSMEAMRRQYGGRWAWEWKDIIERRGNVEYSVPRETTVEDVYGREESGTSDHVSEAVGAGGAEKAGGEAGPVAVVAGGLRVWATGVVARRVLAEPATEGWAAGASGPRGRDRGGGEARAGQGGEAQIVSCRGGGSL